MASDKMYSLCVVPCRHRDSLAVHGCVCVYCAHQKTLLMLLVGRSMVLLNNALADRQMYRSYCIFVSFLVILCRCCCVRIHTYVLFRFVGNVKRMTITSHCLLNGRLSVAGECRFYLISFCRHQFSTYIREKPQVLHLIQHCRFYIGHVY